MTFVPRPNRLRHLSAIVVGLLGSVIAGSAVLAALVEDRDEALGDAGFGGPIVHGWWS